jgi:hypothetical protein
MIEIIVLIFLCWHNRKLARRKGLSPGLWTFYTILGWIVAEIFGVLLGISLMGIDNLIAVMGFGLLAAFGGYLVVRRMLESQPDHPDDIEEDIQRIGVDDLRPPHKN